MGDEDLLVHYWQLPDSLYISLKEDFHKVFCQILQKKINSKRKNCFYIVLNCPRWHSQRLFTRLHRFTIKELELLRHLAGIAKEDVEKNLETVGNKENRAVIKNPKLPFHMKDLVYVASHLIFDGSYREKNGCYFYSYEDSLTEYHKKRLSIFGEVPINFLEGENQLYFSYTVAYIASRILNMRDFRSTKCFLSEKFKDLCKKHKQLSDELIKALIIDDGSIGDKIESELANEILVKDICEVIGKYYSLSKISSRTRTVVFKNNPKLRYTTTVWKINFSASGFKELFLSISPLPISYKEENLKFLFDRQNKNYKQRSIGETRRLIIQSLIEKPKTMDELSKDLLVKRTTIRVHLKGNLNFKETLIGSGIVKKLEERILRRGGFSKVGVYGIKDYRKAKELIGSTIIKKY